MAIISKQLLEQVRLKREDVPSFEKYPFNLDAVRELNNLKIDPRVTFFVGENGSGKSTLLEAIAVKWGSTPTLPLLCRLHRLCPRLLLLA